VKQTAPNDEMHGTVIISAGETLTPILESPAERNIQRVVAALFDILIYRQDEDILVSSFAQTLGVSGRTRNN
jgi:hypothetical protein